MALGPLTGISSMATRALLAELTAAWHVRTGQAVRIESVGGVDAAKRVRAGEVFDLVILASDAIDRLIADGHLAPGRTDLVRSPVAVAVRQGAPRPDLGSEDALKAAVLAAPTVGYSTGPSGTHLAGLFERWGVADTLRERVVTPPPGVPVARWVADGRIALGFQQLSELKDVPGVDVAGLLPEAAAFVTVFSAGRPAAGAEAHGARGDAVRALLDHLTSPETAAIKRRHGMEPA
jgi:molybdate transport system substrate-binding protein